MDKRKVLAGAVCVLSLIGGCVYYSNAQKQKDMELNHTIPLTG